MSTAPKRDDRLRVLRAESQIIQRRRDSHINFALADQHVMDVDCNALTHATDPPAATPAPQVDFEKEKT